jgi:hypothetical protein
MEKEQEQDQPVSGGFATENDVARMVSSPEDFGFEWDAWDAASKTDKEGKTFPSGLVVLRKAFAVIPKITDAEKFQRAFGWASLVKAYNGTSGRVDAQGVARSMLLAEWDKQHAKNVTTNAVRAEVSKRVLLGIRAKGGGGTVKRYVDLDGTAWATAEEAAESNKRIHAKTVKHKALDGQEYATALEAKQASVAFLVTEQGMPHEVALKVVANMPE